MRRLAPLSMLALCLAGCPALGDDLFSEFAVESVFGGASRTSGSQAAAPSEFLPTRITNSGQLGRLLREAGLEPERIDTRGVSVGFPHGDWRIPTTVTAAVDRGQVDVTMGLATAAKGASLSTDKLLSLLAADPDAGGAYFAYDKDKAQVQLRLTVSARDLTRDRLERMLTEMAELAVSREDAWRQPDPKAAKAPDAAAPATPAAPAPLAGSWVATIASGEAFALRLTADGKFALAYVKQGRTTTSKGRAERAAATLKLVGDKGQTITGTVANPTAKGFELTLSTGRKLSFRKAA